MSDHFFWLKHWLRADDLPLGQQQPSMRLFQQNWGSRYAETGADDETNTRIIETEDM